MRSRATAGCVLPARHGGRRTESRAESGLALLFCSHRARRPGVPSFEVGGSAGIAAGCGCDVACFTSPAQGIPSSSDTRCGHPQVSAARGLVGGKKAACRARGAGRYCQWVEVAWELLFDRPPKLPEASEKSRMLSAIAAKRARTTTVATTLRSTSQAGEPQRAGRRPGMAWHLLRLFLRGVLSVSGLGHLGASGRAHTCGAFSRLQAFWQNAWRSLCSQRLTSGLRRLHFGFRRLEGASNYQLLLGTKFISWKELGGSLILVSSRVSSDSGSSARRRSLPQKESAGSISFTRPVHFYSLPSPLRTGRAAGPDHGLRAFVSRDLQPESRKPQRRVVERSKRARARGGGALRRPRPGGGRPGRAIRRFRWA